MLESDKCEPWINGPQPPCGRSLRGAKPQFLHLQHENLTPNSSVTSWLWVPMVKPLKDADAERVASEFLTGGF